MCILYHRIICHDWFSGGGDIYKTDANFSWERCWLGNNKDGEVEFDDKERGKKERNAKTRRDVTITLMVLAGPILAPTASRNIATLTYLKRRQCESLTKRFPSRVYRHFIVMTPLLPLDARSFRHSQLSHLVLLQ